MPAGVSRDCDHGSSEGHKFNVIDVSSMIFFPPFDCIIIININVVDFFVFVSINIVYTLVYILCVLFFTIFYASRLL